MPDISQITIDGTTYDLKDTVARSQGGGGEPIPFFQAVRTSGTTSIAASTITTIPLTSSNASSVKSTNANDYFEFSGNGIKCKVAGTIEINGGCYFNTATSSYSMAVYFKNGNTEIASGAYQTGGGNSRSLNGITVEVAAGDIITLCGRCSSSNTVMNNKSTYLSIKYLDQGSGGSGGGSGGGGSQGWTDISSEFSSEHGRFSGFRAFTNGSLVIIILEDGAEFDGCNIDNPSYFSLGQFPFFGVGMDDAGYNAAMYVDVDYISFNPDPDSSGMYLQLGTLIYPIAGS